MKHQSLAPEEVTQLKDALRRNAEDELAIVLDPADTTFVGTSFEVTDKDIICMIKSVACHY